MLEDEVWIGFQMPTSSSIACFFRLLVSVYVEW